MENHQSTLPESKGFSRDLNLNLKLPGDFLLRISREPVESDLILVLLSFFHLLSSQEKPVQVMQEFTLKEASLDPLFQGNSERLQAALDQALESGLLLRYTDARQSGYLLPGTPEGQALFNALASGEAAMESLLLAELVPLQVRPNIYKLYEANIGPLTPMIAEMLREDETTYPVEWIEDAIGEAVQHNARNWKYVRAILKAWKEKGRGTKDEKDGTDLEKFRELHKDYQRKSGK
ncbi:MAG: DnaD domain protein [Anaerolineaceae bacterium]